MSYQLKKEPKTNWFFSVRTDKISILIYCRKHPTDMQQWHSSKRGYWASKAGVAVLVLEMALTRTLYSLEKWEHHHLGKEKKVNNNQHYRLYTKHYAKFFLSTTSGKVSNVPKSCNSLGLDVGLPIRTPESMIFLLYHTTPWNIYSGLQVNVKGNLFYRLLCYIIKILKRCDFLKQ